MVIFLVRCIDKRYWKYGGNWNIELSVGDQYKDNYRPICYMLHSGNFKGEEALKQMNSLIENMVYHLNHKNFMKGYDLDVKDFKTE